MKFVYSFQGFLILSNFEMYRDDEWLRNSFIMGSEDCIKEFRVFNYSRKGLLGELISTITKKDYFFYRKTHELYDVVDFNEDDAERRLIEFLTYSSERPCKIEEKR